MPSTAPEEILGTAFDEQGGAFVLSAELMPSSPSTAHSVLHAALRLTYVTPAGVARPTIDIHRTSLPAGTRNTYQAAIVSFGAGRCLVTWANIGLEFRAECFDASALRIFSTEVAPPADGARLPMLVRQGANAVVAFFHKTNTSRSLCVRQITRSGAVNWSGTQWTAVSFGFDDRGIPQLAPSSNGSTLVFWQEHGSLPRGIFQQLIAPNGQFVGPSVAVTSSADVWEWRGVRRAVSDGAGGFFLGETSAAGLLTVRHVETIILPRPLKPVTDWITTIGALVHASAFSLAEDGMGGVLVSGVEPTGRLFVRHFDRPGVESWATLNPFGIATLSVAPMGGAPDDFFAYLVGITSNGKGGGIVVYRNLVVQAEPAPLLTTLSYTCVEANGHVETRGALMPVAKFPEHVQLASADPGAAVVAWKDRLSSAPNADWDVIVQKIGCCPAASGTALIPLRRGKIPVDFRPLPQHLTITLPGRSKDGSFGFVPLRDLAAIPGVELPGGLVNPAMPRPEWVRLTFQGMRRDFSLELFSEKGKSVAKAKSADSTNGSPPGSTKQLTFRPNHPGLYTLGVGLAGEEIATGEVHRFRVRVEFGDSVKRRPRSRKRKKASRR